MAIELSTMGSPPGKELANDSNATTSNHRRLKWTLVVLVLALFGVTGIVVVSTNKKNDQPEQLRGNNGGMMDPVDATAPPPEEQEEVTPPKEEETTTLPDDSVPTTPFVPPYGDSGDTAEPSGPHWTCETAQPLELESGRETLSGHDMNPTMTEAASEACQVNTARAAYYKVTATAQGPMSISVHRQSKDDADPVLVSVLTGDSCDTLQCVGYDYNAMTWETTADDGSVDYYIVMIHQVVGEVQWYVWAP